MGVLVSGKIFVNKSNEEYACKHFIKVKKDSTFLL